MPKQILLLEITGIKNEDMYTLQKVGRAIVGNRAIGGTMCARYQESITEEKLCFYDFYTFETLSFPEKVRHLFRKCFATVFGDRYMNRIVKIRETICFAFFIMLSTLHFLDHFVQF